MAVNTEFAPSHRFQAPGNEAIPAYFRSAERVAGNRTANGFISKFMLPPLSSSTIRQIRERSDAIAKDERLEYEREKRRPPEPLKKLPIENKSKQKNKKRTRRPQTHQTRATTEENEFLNPESLDLSLSSAHSNDSSSELSVESESDSTSATEYSDWIADHGVSLEPPKRSRRRRPPRRLSPADQQPTRRRNRKNREEEKPDAEKAPSVSSISPKAETRLEDIPSEFLPPKWLSEVVPRKAPYYPQMGDEVMFFQEGYQLYLDAVRQKHVFKPSTRDSFSKLGLPDPIFAKVVGIKYEIRPPRLCCLRLAVLRSNGVMTSDFFNIKYHDMPDVIDFLVLKQTYDIAMKRKWKAGDRFRCMIDDSWWLGSIANALQKVDNSPFLSLLTKWDNGEEEAMSPWDLEPVDPSRIPTVTGGSIDVLPEETLGLLYSPRADEWPNGDRDGTCDRIVAGIGKVMTLAVAEAFSAPVDLNMYPIYAKTVEYPVDLSTIKARLENRFYRRLIAVQFDVRYLATNAEKFNDVHSQIVKHARIVTDLCLRIIKDQQEDVVAVYHQLVDAYHSCSSDEEVGGKDDHCDSMDWRGDCDRLLRELVAHPDSAPFRQPVDLIEFPDYLQTVEIPMDLGTVREELMAGNYSSPREFYEDMRQIFINSKTYNTNKRSRIYSMSIRLSNLFEARLKQLTAEWKASRRRRIRQSAQTRKKRLAKRITEPGSSKQFVIDENPSCSLTLQSEPQPSTSGHNPLERLEPLRITILRRRSIEARLRPSLDNSSSTDEDTDLSTLRHNYLKKSGSEDDQLRVGRTESVDEDSNFSGKKGREKVITLPVMDDTGGNASLLNDASTSSEGDYQVLSTLRTNSQQPNEVNGHSYAKQTPKTSVTSADSSVKNGVDSKIDESSQDSSDDTGTENEHNANGDDVANEDDDEDSSEDDNNGRSLPKEASIRMNGRKSSSTESAQIEAGSDSSRPTSPDWNEGSSGSESASDSDRDERRPRRPQRYNHKPQTRSRLKAEEQKSTPSMENGRRRQPRQRLPSPRVGRTRRRQQASSDSEASLPTRRKRTRRVPRESGSSASRSSDSEQPISTRRTLRARRPKSESDDSEPLMNVTISSRGRVRKLTARAKAAFGRRD